MELLQSTGASLQSLRHLLTVQDCIYSICSLIRPDPSFYWSIINLALQSEERKWLWRALLSHDPGDSPCFIFGLHGMEIGRWRLNQFPCVGSLAGALGWARLRDDALGGTKPSHLQRGFRRQEVRGCEMHTHGIMKHSIVDVAATTAIFCTKKLFWAQVK